MWVYAAKVHLVRAFIRNQEQKTYEREEAAMRFNVCKLCIWKPRLSIDTGILKTWMVFLWFLLSEFDHLASALADLKAEPAHASRSTSTGQLYLYLCRAVRFSSAEIMELRTLFEKEALAVSLLGSLRMSQGTYVKLVASVASGSVAGTGLR